MGKPNSEISLGRPSLESSPSRRRIASPSDSTVSVRRRPSSPHHANGSTSSSGGSIDYVYLKNVLLQFLEQKDKKHQMQLVPVLGMLLHFDGYVMAGLSSPSSLSSIGLSRAQFLADFSTARTSRDG